MGERKSLPPACKTRAGGLDETRRDTLVSGICGFRSTWVPDVGKAYVNPDVASVGAIAGMKQGP